MGGKNNGKQNSNSYRIPDTDGTVAYTGSWSLEMLSLSNSNEPSSVHTTGETNATFSVSFKGSQIQVIGMIPPGDGTLRANYTIDDDDPDSRRVVGISQNTPLPRQMFYVSPILSEGQHNLTVQVLETGNGRNYSFQMFNVQVSEKESDKGQQDSGIRMKSGGCKQGDKNSNGDCKGTNDAAIVGGVLGTIIFLILVFIAAYYFWRRRRLARMRKSGEQRLPPMMYYARPMSYGTQRGLYTLEPASAIDTDSKFTFAVRRDQLEGSHRSWVSVDLPPSMPDSALVSDRPISSWSYHNGRSIIVQPLNPEASRFSAYTSTVPPSAFTERTETSAPTRGAGPPSQRQIQVSSPRRDDTRMF